MADYSRLESDIYMVWHMVPVYQFHSSICEHLKCEGESYISCFQNKMLESHAWTQTFTKHIIYNSADAKNELEQTEINIFYSCKYI